MQNSVVRDINFSEKKKQKPCTLDREPSTKNSDEISPGFSGTFEHCLSFEADEEMADLTDGQMGDFPRGRGRFHQP